MSICVRQVVIPQRMLDLRPSDYAAAKQARVPSVRSQIRTRQAWFASFRPPQCHSKHGVCHLCCKTAKQRPFASARSQCHNACSICVLLTTLPQSKHDFRPSGRKSVRGRRDLLPSGRNAIASTVATSQSQCNQAKTICVRQVAMP